MIEVDGSHGEGGGQILRTAVSLSAVTRTPVRVVNIRSKRKNPGLAPSHMTSIEAIGRMADADLDGLYPGSTTLEFRPRSLLGGQFEFDVGTAGSISLVLLTCLLPAIVAKAPTTITVKGGTDVNWSPPIDFMRLVHLPLLTRFGAACELEVRSRGFYPQGGGEVTLEVAPTGGLAGVDLSSTGRVLGVEGICYVQNLPKDVASRIKHAAVQRLVDGWPVAIDEEAARGPSTGAGIVLAARCENTILGASALGAKGIRSETLGEQCASDLTETVHSGETVDEHMLDQILPYMALAKGASTVLAEELTQHAETNLWVIQKFMGDRLRAENRDGLVAVTTA